MAGTPRIAIRALQNFRHYDSQRPGAFKPSPRSAMHYTSLTIELLQRSAAKIDDAIINACDRKEFCVSLWGHGDDGDTSGILGNEISAIRANAQKNARSVDPVVEYDPFVDQRMLWVIRRWILKRYDFNCDVYDASDGCNQTWVINFRATA